MNTRNTPSRPPFKEMESLQNLLSTLFGRAPVRRQNGEEESITVAEWAPLVDITEDEKEYLIKAELPEVKKVLSALESLQPKEVAK
jgi:HSP20 family protein